MRAHRTHIAVIATIAASCACAPVASTSSPRKHARPPVRVEAPHVVDEHAGVGVADDANLDANGEVPTEHVEVFAPYADSIHVAGSFNGWDTNASALTNVGGGLWAGDVESARPGDQYKLVVRRGDQMLWRIDPRARAAVSSTGNAIFYDDDAFVWTDAQFVAPKKNELVVYELHIGTFNAGSDAHGTFDSAIEKLDWLKALSVNAIEIMPPYEFAGDRSWGYNPALPFAIESSFGGPDAMKRFVDAAHARGIAVIVDVVHNHWGPSDLPMWCFDGNCLGTDNGGAYFYTGDRRETGWGPRPDYGRAQIRDFIVDSATTTIDAFHADGLRWDSTVNIRQANGQDLADGRALLARANDEVHALRPNVFTVAEDFRNDASVTRATSSNGLGFDAQWDGDFFHPVANALQAVDDSQRDLGSIAAAIAPKFDDAFDRVVYTEDHDEDANGRERMPAMIDPQDPASFYAKKRSTLGAVLVMTSPGVPMMFMGQEMLMDGFFTDAKALDWTKADAHAGIVALYHDLISLRRNLDGHTRGLEGAHVQVTHRNDAKHVIAYRRFDQGGVDDDVVVLANFSNHAFPSYDIGVAHAGAWIVRFNSDDVAYDAGYADVAPASTCVMASSSGYDGLPARITLAVGTYSAVIASYAGDACP